MRGLVFGGQVLVLPIGRTGGTADPIAESSPRRFGQRQAKAGGDPHRKAMCTGFVREEHLDHIIAEDLKTRLGKRGGERALAGLADVRKDHQPPGDPVKRSRRGGAGRRGRAAASGIVIGRT